MRDKYYERLCQEILGLHPDIRHINIVNCTSGVVEYEYGRADKPIYLSATIMEHLRPVWFGILRGIGDKLGGYWGPVEVLYAKFRRIALYVLPLDLDRIIAVTVEPDTTIDLINKLTAIVDRAAERMSSLV